MIESEVESRTQADDVQDRAVEKNEAPRGADTGAGNRQALHGAVIGVLLGFQDDGSTPLVIYPGQIGGVAVPARATEDIHGAHIGRQVVLIFEGADPRYPLIVGCLPRADGAALLKQPPAHVEVDCDGDRLIVTAKEQLVLRCGAASITLTKAGKVLIRGAYVSSTSTGVNRINGGSVQLN